MNGEPIPNGVITNDTNDTRSSIELEMNTSRHGHEFAILQAHQIKNAIGTSVFSVNRSDWMMALMKSLAVQTRIFRCQGIPVHVKPNETRS